MYTLGIEYFCSEYGILDAGCRMWYIDTRFAICSMRFDISLKLVGVAMKFLYIKVVLFDPVTEEEYPVSDGIQVEIVKILDHNPLVGFDPLRLKYDTENELFFTKSRKYQVSKSHYLRIGFKKANFSKSDGKLLSKIEVDERHLPIYCPSRLPYWDSGWDDEYETNEFFDNDVLIDSSESSPLMLKIPLRLVYNIGHRGAPHHFPENTMASFEKALDLGANGFEFDICITKDKKLVLFHDPEPVKHPDRLDRTFFESLPYELVSPEFTPNGRFAIIKELKNGLYKVGQKVLMPIKQKLDLIKLTVTQIRKYYKYHHVNQVEYEIPELSEFLEFSSKESNRIQILFFDVKNPDWDDEDDANLYIDYGKRIGDEIKKYPILPARLIICNASEEVLIGLKTGIDKSGENRCEFAFDAQGSFGAIFGFKNNPLHVARKMGNTVISIGSLFRPGNLGEMIEATRDRDYNKKSKISTVIHWTLNEPSQIYNSISSGVNGIVTDKPDLLKEQLYKLGVKVDQ
jgi:glycerophosphoryl diester phosphodiesterase